MEIIKELVQTLIIIVVLAVFLDMLLPTGQMKPYVKMVMGLLIIIAVLQAISGLLLRDWLGEVPSVKARPGGSEPSLEEIMAAGKQLELKNRDMALEKYRQGISNQVLSMARLNPGARVVDAEVELCEETDGQNGENISRIILVVDPSAQELDEGNTPQNNIEPVHVEVKGSTNSKNSGQESEIPPHVVEEVKKVTDYISGFYSLNPNQVSIKYKVP